MKNLKTLLAHYRLNVVISKNELKLLPKFGEPGCEMILQGNFNNMEQASITNFAIDGLVFDYVKDSEIDEEFFLELLKKVLDGKYRYSLKSKTFLDRIKGGSIYISIDGVVKNFRCVNQPQIRRMFKNGELKTVVYKKNQ